MDSRDTNLSTVCSHLVQECPSSPFCELKVMAQPLMSSKGQHYLFEPVTTTRLPVQAACALVSPSSAGVPVRLMNPMMDSVTLNKGTRVAQLDSIDGLTTGPVMKEAAMTGQIATDSLTPGKKEALR